MASSAMAFSPIENEINILGIFCLRHRRRPLLKALIMRGIFLNKR